MRRSALHVIPVLLLALNGCGGGGGGGTAGHGGSSAGGHGGSGARGGSSGSGGRGGTGGAAGTTGGSSGGTTGGSSGGATGGSGGATGGSSGGGSGGSAGGGSSGAGGSAGNGGGAGGTAGSGGAGGGNGGSAGSGGVGGVGGGIGGVGGTGGVGGVGGVGGGAGAGGLAMCGTNTDADVGLTCNTVIANGPCPSVTIGTGSPPTATGGQWVAGTYELTSRTVYNAPSGFDPTMDNRRETVVVSGSGTDFSIQMAQLSGTQVRRQNGTVTTSSATHQFTFTQVCPPPGDGGDNGGTIDYTTDGSTITIYDMGNNGTVRLDLYTKR